MEQLVSMLRAAGDDTRLRLLLLLLEAELTVSELTQILGQSQPRVSRHLKLLCEAGLLQRFKEGAWVFYRAAERGGAAQLAKVLASLTDATEDATLIDDARRLARVRSQRAEEAAAYFKANAPQWEEIRSLHVPEQDVENAVVRLLGHGQLGNVLDAGTGTGRMLELLAPHVERGIGLDQSAEMLAIARDRLAKADAAHCQVRRGDVYRLPFADGDEKTGFDAVIFHQVLHYLDDPQAALREAIRVAKPGGRILIADFAPHELEFLRAEHAHRRLGFANSEVQGWFEAAGLKSLGAEALAPRSGVETLTVMVWLGETAGGKAARNVEAAA
ncbi:MAG: metalloregulator ArsR/SmtB family transcription factor [Alphaproteobacteria bacterium]|nr:metalloregulator ArsR/SmtB family transcription factor [Alphaproteobacteria bacterium]